MKQEHHRTGYQHSAEQPPQSHAHQKNHPHKQIGMLIALILFILILLAGVGYLVWSTFADDSTSKDTTAASDDQSTTNDGFTADEESEVPAKKVDPVAQKVSDTLASMTTEEKVAQLFFLTPEELTGVEVVLQAGDTTKQCLSNYPVGGIIYFGQNIESQDQLTTMIQNSQSYSKIPLFIGVDEEGGSLVARIANSGLFDVPKVDDMATIGATGDASKAYDVGTTIGRYLAPLGFNVDFAPDSDVLVNPNNEAIGIRSFGPDPNVDAQMVSQVVKGLQDQGVSATLKHFPGHGSTTTDSHNGAAIVDRSLTELQSAEFVPFEAGIQQGVDFVMVGHLEVPQIVSDGTPASLSSAIVTDQLRNALGFDSIVITDSLSMGAITDYYTPDQAAVAAILAGDDMLLMPNDFQTAYQGVLDAVSNGTITEDRLNDSVMRILSVKYK